MFRFLFKYSALLFILNTILLSIKPFYQIGNQFFLLLMGLMSIVIVSNPNQIKKIIFHKAFSFLLILNLINFIYFLIFHNLSEIESIKYLIARFLQFTIISSSIFINFSFYKTNFLNYLVNIIFLICLAGLVFNPNLLQGRYSGIMWNPNAFASFSVISFAILFFKLNKNKFQVFMMIFFMILSLSTGSRGVIVALVLAFLIRYGISFKNVGFSLMGVILFFIVTNFQFETSINRLATQTLLNDRIIQYEYAIKSISNKLYTGYGLDKYAYLDKSLVPIYLKSQIIGAHNGYLAILTQLGIFFGSISLIIILRKSFILIIKHISNNQMHIYVFILLYTLIASIYESLIVGINEFITILFWFSLSKLSFYKYQLKSNNEN